MMVAQSHHHPSLSRRFLLNREVSNQNEKQRLDEDDDHKRAFSSLDADSLHNRAGEAGESLTRQSSKQLRTLCLFSYVIAVASGI